MITCIVKSICYAYKPPAGAVTCPPSLCSHSSTVVSSPWLLASVSELCAVYIESRRQDYEELTHSALVTLIEHRAVSFNSYFYHK